MTDTERDRVKAICEAAGVKEIDDLSDGFHTFRQLYYQRMMLFATIVKQNKDRAWKSLRHEDGELCFGGGWFIVGIDTPEGSYTYHYEDNYFSLFDCEELECGKHWDGHTEKDVTRLLSLPSARPEYYDYSDIEPLWKSFAEENDINLTDTAKQLKDAMWCGYRKGKADAQLEPSQVARDIATIIENEKDMRVIARSEVTEVIPHRNYQYVSDYWCECGWHLGKIGDVNYCPNCGKKVKWDERYYKQPGGV